MLLSARESALFGGKVTENPELRPGGDVVHVASRYITVSVFGRVATPGTLELPKRARALDAIGACGGGSLQMATILGSA